MIRVKGLGFVFTNAVDCLFIRHYKSMIIISTGLQLIFYQVTNSGTERRS